MFSWWCSLNLFVKWGLFRHDINVMRAGLPHGPFNSISKDSFPALGIAKFIGRLPDLVATTFYGAPSVLTLASSQSSWTFHHHAGDYLEVCGVIDQWSVPNTRWSTNTDRRTTSYWNSCNTEGITHVCQRKHAVGSLMIRKVLIHAD